MCDAGGLERMAPDQDRQIAEVVEREQSRKRIRERFGCWHAADEDAGR